MKRAFYEISINEIHDNAKNVYLLKQFFGEKKVLERVKNISKVDSDHICNQTSYYSLLMDAAVETYLSSKPDVLGYLCIDPNGMILSGL